MRRGLRLILPLLLVVLLVGTALMAEQTHMIYVTIPEFLELELSATSIDLGSFMVNGVLMDRIASTEPLVVKYRCNHTSGWELKVSANDFVHTARADVTIPAAYLSWGKDADAINNVMANHESVVETGMDPVDASINIYYAMDLPENSLAGEYSSTVTYTLVAL
ncbi:MAG TPA: hypothetical protein GXZ98_08440 [Firmicutes bacterium]|nr:hypothetical protein [Bacillota bacterium]